MSRAARAATDTVPSNAGAAVREAMGRWRGGFAAVAARRDGRLVRDARTASGQASRSTAAAMAVSASASSSSSSRRSTFTRPSSWKRRSTRLTVSAASRR